MKLDSDSTNDNLGRVFCRPLLSMTAQFENTPGLDARVLQQIAQEMAAIKENHPQWFADYEDSDPVTAPRQDVEELLVTSPTDFSRGLLTGMVMFRQQLACLTNRY